MYTVADVRDRISDLLGEYDIPLATVPALVVALILLRVGFTQARRWSAPMEYTVKWGRERLKFSLPSLDTNLAVIRHDVAEYTQLPEKSFKLVHAGAVMKDDNTPISAYGIRAGSTIALIGGDALAEPKAAKAKPAERKTEETVITQIQTELARVRTSLGPDVDVFLASLPAAPASASASTSTSTAAAPAAAAANGTPSAPGARAISPEQEVEHTRLGEFLLQALLRLDAIVTDGEWVAARTERKTAVREVQALLDRLDGGWKTAKTLARI